MIWPSRLKAKRIVYSLPRRASSFGGGVQHARNAAYISRIESKDFSCAVLSVSSALLLATVGILAESLSSVETMVRRRSWPIGGRNCEKHGPKSKTLQNDESGSLLGNAGETGVSFTRGKVYGVDGLKTGGSGGGTGGVGGGTNCRTCCACAWLNAPAIRAIQPATKQLETALRPNLTNDISFPWAVAPVLISHTTRLIHPRLTPEAKTCFNTAGGLQLTSSVHYVYVLRGDSL